MGFPLWSIAAPSITSQNIVAWHGMPSGSCLVGPIARNENFDLFPEIVAVVAFCVSSTKSTKSKVYDWRGYQAQRPLVGSEPRRLKLLKDLLLVGKAMDGEMVKSLVEGRSPLRQKSRKCSAD
jgi:hypothetical protein